MAVVVLESSFGGSGTVMDIEADCGGAAAEGPQKVENMKRPSSRNVQRTELPGLCLEPAEHGFEDVQLLS